MSHNKKWALTVVKSQKIDTVLKNAGFTTETNSVLEPNSHYCSDCNDRDKDMFYVVDGHGEEFLGEIKAWGDRSCSSCYMGWIRV